MVFAQTAAGQIRLLYVARNAWKPGDSATRRPYAPMSLISRGQKPAASPVGSGLPLVVPLSAIFIAGLPQRHRWVRSRHRREQVRRDIVGLLGLRNPAVTVTGFDRPNLYFDVVKLEANTRPHGWRGMWPTIRTDPASSAPPQDHRSAHRRAEQMGHPAVAYHGGMSPDARERPSATSSPTKVPVVVAQHFRHGHRSVQRALRHYHNLPDH